MAKYRRRKKRRSTTSRSTTSRSTTSRSTASKSAAQSGTPKRSAATRSSVPGDTPKRSAATRSAAPRKSAPKSAAHGQRPATPIRRSKKKKGFGAFLRRNIKFVAVGAFVVVIGVIALFLFVIGKDDVPAAEVADAAPTNAAAETSAQPETDTANGAAEDDMFAEPEVSVEVGEFDEEAEYAIENVDDEMLAGLEGSDDSLFTDVDEEMQDALFAEEGIRIGVTIGELASDNDKMLLGKLEGAASLAETAKEVYEVYFYNAAGDYNQQVQDVRSMIKNEVDVIIVGATDKRGFDMITAMAGDEGIPVVAYDAPEGTSGYVMNVVADQIAWGKRYGDFMAANLPEGEVFKVLGSAESELDQQRENAINTALAVNEALEMPDTVYAEWSAKKAGAEMAAILEKNSEIDGIITEEGMALAILEKFVEARTLPAVMCGDATAGFIKLWYTLRSQGVDITPPPEDDNDDDENAPEPEKVYFTAADEELIVYVQPAPVTIGAVAFDIAQKLAEGRVLKNEGATFTYAVEAFVSDDNLMDVYVMIKDQPDDYVLRDIAADETIEALFQPAAEETDE